MARKPAPDPAREYLAGLEANLAQLEEAKVTAKDAYLAGLSREYRATLEEITRLRAAQVVKVVSPLDELEAKRKDRLSKANPVAASKRPVRKRGA